MKATVQSQEATITRSSRPTKLRGLFSMLLLWSIALPAAYPEGAAKDETIRVSRAKPTILPMAGVSRIEIEDPSIAVPTILADDRVIIQGKKSGKTVLTFWKDDQKTTVALIVEETGSEPVQTVTAEKRAEPEASEEATPQPQPKKIAETPDVATVGTTVVAEMKDTKPTFEPAKGETEVSVEKSIVPGGKPTPWVKLSATPAPANPGEILLTLQIGNRGDGKATKVVVRDPLPPELEYVKDSATEGGAYEAENREIVWKFDELGLGADQQSSHSVSFRARPAVGPDGPSKIMNIATIECAELEALFASNTVSWELKSEALTAVFALPEEFLARRTIMMPMLDIRGEEFQNAVDRLEGLGVVSGYPDRKFRPDSFVNRAESVKLVVLGANLKDHRDVTRITAVIARPAKVTVAIKDSVGKVVKTLMKGQQKPPGDHTIAWDGRADAGEFVKAGVYSYAVKATEASGKESSLQGNLTVLGVEHGNIVGAPSFKDVTPNDWYSGYVAEAEDRQYIKGYPDKSFKPRRRLSRVEATAIVVRALGLEKDAQRNSGKDVGFIDARKVPKWATGYVAVASMTAPKSKNQLIIGYPGNTFLPENSIRRTEAAAIVARFIDRNTRRQQIVSGSLLPGATLTINGKSIEADGDGHFRAYVDFLPNEVTTIAILAR